MSDRSPDLSVVVTVVSGGASARRTMARLLGGPGRPWLEVLVPLETDHPERHALETGFPAARFPAVAVPPHASEHERYDRRRTAGIQESRGAVIAILEDHGTPAEDWADRVRAAHAGSPRPVVGGVVANGIPTGLNDALWLCDFGRYAPPQAAGPRETLTDVNVSYERAALLAVRDAWESRYHEPVVHEALRARGATLWLDPAMVVAQERPRLPLHRALLERFEWGRLYGSIRSRGMGAGKRVLWAAMSCGVMPILFGRILRVRRGRIGARRFLAAAPWIAILLLSWSVGEAAGTLSGSYNPLPTKEMR